MVVDARRVNRSLLKSLQGEWAPPDPSPGMNLAENLRQIQEQLAWVQQAASMHLAAVKAKQKTYYDRGATLCSFQEGDRVLVRALLFPRQATKK